MSRRITPAAIQTLGLAMLMAACGGSGDAPSETPDREVKVMMTDNAFSPNSISVSAGETVTFKFTNSGAVTHDAFIGDAAAQEKHGESMGSGEMKDHNVEDAEALSLDPGKSGEMTYTFDEEGEILIGCHQPGHYEAGMKSTVTVS